jgi:hypothetical protein
MTRSGADDDKDDARGPADESERPGPLICQQDDIEVPAADVRCMHPSSQCRFREWCEITKILRAMRRSGRE